MHTAAKDTSESDVLKVELNHKKQKFEEHSQNNEERKDLAVQKDSECNAYISLVHEREKKIEKAKVE